MTSCDGRPLITSYNRQTIIYDVTQSLNTSNKLMTSYVSMTSYTLTRVTAYLHCDVMGRIANISNRTSDRGKSYWIPHPYNIKAPNEEIYGKWTQGTQCWKIHWGAYNVVADNTGLSKFVYCCCMRNSLRIWNTVQVFNFQGPRHQQHPWFSGYQQQQMFSGTSIEEGTI